MDNCNENATCNNTFGSFECTCNAGFEGDGVNCTSKTSNLVMAFIDNLPDQIIMMYTYYAVAVKLPLLLSIDINECELETDNCHVYANCTDTIGSFECTCNSGYEGDGVNCTSMYELKMAFCSAYIPTLCTCCGMSLKILYWCWNVIKHIQCNLIVP